MSDYEKRVGHIHSTHIDYPLETLSGQAYERPATTRGLSGGRFVVLDPFLQPGFDIDAEIDKLVEAGKAAKAADAAEAAAEKLSVSTAKFDTLPSTLPSNKP